MCLNLGIGKTCLHVGERGYVHKKVCYKKTRASVSTNVSEESQPNILTLRMYIHMYVLSGT
jgi:hypothetical protein